MQEVRTILLKKSVFEDNDRAADALRAGMKAKRTCIVNVMSSPGSGKTTLLVALIGMRIPPRRSSSASSRQETAR